MSLGTIVGVIVICGIVSSCMVTYFVTDYYEKQETNKIVVNYKEDVQKLNSEHQNIVNTLNTNLSNLEENLNLIKNENKGFDKQIIKGYEKVLSAELNRGVAVTYYGEASEYYNNDLYYSGYLYASYADTYYGYASTEYRDAKAYFEKAMEYTVTTNAYNFAKTYVDLCEINAKISSEMHEANEYFSSACYQFDLGNYEVGNTEIEKMNIHIDEHDSFIYQQNDLVSKLDVIIENYSEI